jgi:hypothetical protein
MIGLIMIATTTKTTIQRKMTSSVTLTKIPKHHHVTSLKKSSKEMTTMKITKNKSPISDRQTKIFKSKET